ncbi:hypothetical protein ABI59_10965 [Acidobacteria bacterium Mor1]|nr:hypothetical protein ABI59_10965 [Acidobacteria bacterium Mor1]
MGGSLAAPAPAVIGDPPADLPVESVAIADGRGGTLKGWFIPAEGKTRAGVLLAHGVRANRRSMLARAQFLREQGYASLALDLQAHGESDGEQITFGYLESQDVRNGVEALRGRIGGKPVAAIGVSLGAASCVLGEKPLPVDALVLESMYSSIELATANRLRARFGAPGAWAFPLLTMQLPLRSPIPQGYLRPLERIGSVSAPVLLLGGRDDLATTAAETRALFEAAPEPKDLWIVDGAGHVDLHRAAQEEYERRILLFFELYLDAGLPNAVH